MYLCIEGVKEMKRCKEHQLVERPGKRSYGEAIITAILLLIGLVFWLAGCTTVTIDAPPIHIKATSFCKDITLDEVYIDVTDPNKFVLWLTDYEGRAKDGKLRFNPLTRQIEAVVEGESK